MSIINASRVKKAILPADFYASEIPSFKAASRVGWVVGGLCPFHSESHAGSFRIDTRSGAFICHACGVKGADIISYLMQRDGLSFKGALDYLVKLWGVL